MSPRAQTATLGELPEGQTLGRVDTGGLCLRIQNVQSLGVPVSPNHQQQWRPLLPYL